MAEIRIGDVAGKDLLTTPPAATHTASNTGEHDTGSDKRLLDISETGFNVRNIITAERTSGSQEQMKHWGSRPSEELAGPRDHVDPRAAQYGLLYDGLQESHQIPHSSSGTCSPTYQQLRHNPFDFPVHDLSQSVRPTFSGHTPTGVIGNSNRSEINRFDQYDPINFGGDPTFVNSYSSTPSSLSASGPGSANFVNSPTTASAQASSPGQKATRFLEKVNRSSRISALPSYSDSSLASTSSVYGTPADPWRPVDKATLNSQFITPINRSQPIQPDYLKGQLNQSVPSPANSIPPTDGTIDSRITNPVLDYKYPNTDLFIRDYTSLAENNKLSTFPSLAAPKSVTDRGLRYANPVGASSESNASVRAHGETRAYTRGLHSGQPQGFNMSLGDETTADERLRVQSISNNRFVDVSNLSSRPLDQFHSLVKEGSDNGAHTHAGMSSWSDAAGEDMFLEETPLLEVEGDHKRVVMRGVLSAWSGASRDSAPLDSHLRDKPGVTSRITEEALEYRGISNRRSGYAEDHDECGVLTKSVRGRLEGSHSATKLAPHNRSVFHRNSNGEFNPFPHFSENGGIRHTDSGELRSSTPFRHCHKPSMGSLTDKLARRQLVSVTVLCLLFMIGEAVGGVLANSLALFTDVLHLGSDLISFVISLVAMWLANKPATKRMSFGYHRAEVIGALVSVFIIWLVSGVLCYIAVDRIVHEHYKSVKADEMLITASLGVIFNIIMGFVLHSEMCCGHAHSHSKFGHGHSHGSGGHGHSHSTDGHGHSHGTGGHSQNHVTDNDLLDVPEPRRRENNSSSRQEGFDYQQLHHVEDVEQAHHEMRDVNSMAIAAPDEELHSEEEDHPCVDDSPHKQKNINVRAAFIHVVGDIIQSLGVLVAALIIKFTSDEKYRLADPICTFLFSLLVLITTITVLRDTLLVIMEGVPRDVSIDSIRKELAALHGVATVHSLHVWSLTLDRNAISVHIVVENTALHDQVLSSATKLIQDKHRFFHSTIQVELLDEIAMKNCKECSEWT